MPEFMSLVQDAFAKLIEKSIEEKKKEILEKAMQEFTYEMDKAFAGLSIKLMKVVEFNQHQDNIVITLKKENFK